MEGDAVALAGAIAAGMTTAGAALEAAIKAAQDLALLGAVADLNLDAARARAARLDEGGDAGPLRGVPMLVKDLGGPFAGLPVRAGSAALEGAKPVPAGDLAARFDALGLNPFGLTTVPEFGLSLATEPAAGQPTRNPLNPERTPGGSSGGAAAAVASGIVAIAHATDAGGSIRVPAACCGLVGLKPTRGAVPAGPGFDNLIGGLAAEFVVTRSVRDAAIAFDHLAGGTPGPFAPPKRLTLPEAPRIGLLADCGADHAVAPQVSETCTAAARALGPAPTTIRWPELAPLVADSGRVFSTLVAVNLAELFDRSSWDEARIEPLTAAMLDVGRGTSATALWRAQTVAATVSHRLAALFDQVDIVVTPMLSGPPPELGAFPTDHADLPAHWRRMADFAPLAALANVSGFPALTLPFGTDAAGLPIAVQLVAPMGGDAVLLKAAARLEAEGRWRHRFPVAGLAA